MRALVTNDDGIHSAGLSTLARSALAVGLEVVVAAPHTEYSGTSASLTALEADGRLIVRDATPPGLDNVKALAVEATPAFIVFAAAHGAFGPAPDLVLSGVNCGPNTGHAVLHSGTVGAALTGRSHGASSLAVSCTAPRPVHWDTSFDIAERTLRWMLERPASEPFALSVNVPDLPRSSVRGLHHARLAAFGAVQAEIGERGDDYVTMTFNPVDEDREEGTDVALLEGGWATLTALDGPCEATRVDLSGLTDTG